MTRTGAYVLLFRLARAERIAVGRLGDVALAHGQYAYVGSAMNGLDARIERHLRARKQRHWHIDYLLERATVTAVLEFESAIRLECELNARLLLEIRSAQPVRGFGSSDCRCRSHLHYLGRSLPGVRELAATLGGQVRTADPPM